MEKQFYTLLKHLVCAVLFICTYFSGWSQVGKYQQVSKERISIFCTTPPSITCPPDFKSCPGSSIHPDLCGAAIAYKGSPECSEPIVSFKDLLVKTGNCAGASLIQRVWTASDPNDATLRAFCIQYINTLDTTAPELFNCPKDTTLLSNDKCTASYTWKMPLVSDACGKFCVVSSHVNGGEFSIGTHTVVITVTDDCGNTSRCIFNVTVVSNCCNIAPIIHCPASIQACTGSSIDPATTGKPSVSKGSPACKEPQLNYTDKLNFISNCNYTIERTWTATDPDHSNLTSHCTQLIHIKDTIAPQIIFCPPNITVQSDADCTAKVSWAEPKATDNCGIASISSSVPSGYQFALGLAAVSIIATDLCGNTTKCEFLVTVEENCCNKNPVIHCPADFQGCPNGSTNPTITGQATANPGSAKCRQPIITYNDDTIQHTACFTEIHRTWLATDPDKPILMDYCIQKIILTDTKPPVITFCPPNITVQSDDDCLATVRWNEPTAIDDCGVVSITTSVPSGYRFALGLAAVSVIATDVCGNTSKCEFLVTVEENCCKSAPVLHCPSNYTACPGTDIQPATTGFANATPGSAHCANPVISYQDDTIQNDNCLFVLNRTWKASDPTHPLLTATCIQTIRLEDKTGPVLTACPSDITINSEADCSASIAWHSPIATDACGDVTLTESIPSGSKFQVGTTSVSITATDKCGNSSNCTFNVTVVENCCKSIPIIHCPADYTSCPGAVIDPLLSGQATAFPGDTNCRQPLLTFTDEVTSQSVCFTSINRIWKATDPIFSNLTSTCIQKIILQDTEAPVFNSCPGDTTVLSNDLCTAIVNWNPATASDACSQIVFTSSITSGSTFPLGITNVVVTATDACGNSSTCNFNVTVTENCCNYPPVISCPEDYTGCPGSSIDTSITGKAIADPFQPVCQAAVIAYSDVVLSNDPCRTIIARLWTATNPKNNLQTQCTQTIVLEDVDPPSFANCPADITIDPQYDCNANVNWTEPSTSDNCGIFSVEKSHLPGSVFSKGVTRVVYTATDLCGNTSSCWFFITVTEKCCDKNPVLNCPADYHGCPGLGVDPFVTGIATATPGSNECFQPNITYSDRIITDGPCAGAISLERTWTATDPALPNLKSECIQRIELKDDVKPILMNIPANITVDANGKCSVVVSWLKPEAGDNCKLLSLTSNYNPGDLFSKGITNVIYTAKDYCGNTTTNGFTVFVEGTEVGVNCPNDTAVVRTDPFLNGAIVNWNNPIVNYCQPCQDDIPGMIYMGELNGHRYFCSKGAANWNAARISCELMGGTLACINSEEENKFLASKLNGQTAWTGGTDEKNEGWFEWINKSQFKYSSWMPGQPNNGSGNEDYIELLPDGNWNDQNESANREFILELPCYELKQIGGPAKGDLVPCGDNLITYVATKDGKSDTCSFMVSVDCEKETSYCKPKAQNSSYMFINRVEFSTIDTTTGDNGGYHYFNKPCGTIDEGQTYWLCVTPGYLSTLYKVYWKLWIDFNADGYFDPFTEEVVYGYGNTSMCANIKMPSNLPSKLTRMRIIMSYSDYPPNPCFSPLFGEVEDYCIAMDGAVQLGSGIGVGSIRVKPVELVSKEFNRMEIADEKLTIYNDQSISFLVDLYPNPSSQAVNINSIVGEIAEFEIYNGNGKLILHSDPQLTKNENAISVEEWANGIYTIIIRSKTSDQLIKRFVVNH